MSGYVHGPEATENGARPVLSKPFALSELLRRVRALLDARASR